MILEEHRDDIVQSIFIPCEQPVLEEPAVPAKKVRGAGKVTGQQTTLRRSTRQ
jgi:hypothetical protein